MKIFSSLVCAALTLIAGCADNAVDAINWHGGAVLGKTLTFDRPICAESYQYDGGTGKAGVSAVGELWWPGAVSAQNFSDLAGCPAGAARFGAVHAAAFVY